VEFDEEEAGNVAQLQSLLADSLQVPVQLQQTVHQHLRVLAGSVV
jgi:hypothetical protein